MLSSGTLNQLPGPPHFVDLHVNPGRESVSIQLYDGHETVLRGPTTIKMVSQQAYPPMPMPVQVPPGHMIQQIVDEHGTLKHIILSALNTNGNAINGSTSPVFGAGVQQNPLAYCCCCNNTCNGAATPVNTASVSSVTVPNSSTQSVTNSTASNNPLVAALAVNQMIQPQMVFPNSVNHSPVTSNYSRNRRSTKTFSSPNKRSNINGNIASANSSTKNSIHSANNSTNSSTTKANHSNHQSRYSKSSAMTSTTIASTNQTHTDNQSKYRLNLINHHDRSTSISSTATTNHHSNTNISNEQIFATISSDVHKHQSTINNDQQHHQHNKSYDLPAMILEQFNESYKQYKESFVDDSYLVNDDQQQPIQYTTNRSKRFKRLDSSCVVIESKNSKSKYSSRDHENENLGEHFQSIHKSPEKIHSKKSSPNDSSTLMMNGRDEFNRKINGNFEKRTKTDPKSLVNGQVNGIVSNLKSEKSSLSLIKEPRILKKESNKNKNTRNDSCDSNLIKDNHSSFAADQMLSATESCPTPPSPVMESSSPSLSTSANLTSKFEPEKICPTIVLDNPSDESDLHSDISSPSTISNQNFESDDLQKQSHQPLNSPTFETKQIESKKDRRSILTSIENEQESQKHPNDYLVENFLDIPDSNSGSELIETDKTESESDENKECLNVTSTSLIPKHSLPKIEALALFCSATSSTSVRLKWNFINPNDYPESIATKRNYIVDLMLKSQQTNQHETISSNWRMGYQGSSTSCRIGHLQPQNDYLFRVQTYTPTESLISNILTVSTAALSQPGSYNRSGGRRTNKQLHQQVTQQQQLILHQQQQLLQHQHLMEREKQKQLRQQQRSNSNDSLIPAVVNADQGYALLLVAIFTIISLIVAVFINHTLGNHW
ncbi:hypothetical protein QR98_0002480 [Sarcoptes scabiei]|uniref:Uncharacterized protein n=1 Tax=Sarcoptes scabiei TaxID=52283 RepID=A0A131ZSY4_SARSC|nr:hypothetical protein QR98_0002480 [Sarcoptes scabiei]